MKTGVWMWTASLATSLVLAGAALAQQWVPGNDILLTSLVSAPAADAAYEAAASDACCPSSACGDMASCSLCPVWTIEAGALIMDRERPHDRVLVTDGFGPRSAELLNADDFDFDVRGGWELGVIRHDVDVFGACMDLEARYARIDGWEATVGPIVSPFGAVVRLATPLGYVGAPAALSASYQSHYDSFELNLRQPVGCGWLTVLGGFRFAELDERGSLLMIPGGDQIDGDQIGIGGTVSAINDLYGFQLGADACLWQYGRFSVDGMCRAGVYGNRAVNNVLVTIDGFSLASRARDDKTSFLGEAGLTGTCQLTDSLALTAGYRLLWLEGVALAPDQVPVSDPAFGTAIVDTSGGVFYHGVQISMEFVW